MVKGEKKVLTESSRDVTLHLHKRVHRVQFKKKCPRAIREIKSFAVKYMKTEDVRIDTPLNKFLWSNGIRNIPKRVRVRLSRRKNDEENAKTEFYTLVQHVPVDTFNGLRSEKSKLE